MPHNQLSRGVGQSYSMIINLFNVIHAHLHWVQGVASSNLVVPTNQSSSGFCRGFFTTLSAMRSLLVFLFLFQFIVGGYAIQALAQDGSITIRHNKEAWFQWPAHLYAGSKKTSTVAGLDQKSALVIRNSLDYHQALVKRDLKAIKFRTSNYLSYVHSNGWGETQKDQLRNLETGYLVYHSFQEDSMTVSSQSQLDFNATIDVTLNGKRNTYRLKITEVWAVIPGGGKGYHLICRKAIRL